MKIIKLVKSEFIKNYTVKKLVVIMLLLTPFCIGLTQLTDLWCNNVGNYENSHSVYRAHYEKLLQKENLTVEEQYELYYNKVNMETAQFLKENKVAANDWKVDVIRELTYALLDNYSIKILREHKNDPIIEAICNSENQYYYESRFSSAIHHTCTAYTDVEQDELVLNNVKLIDEYTYLLKEDKYYLYIQYLIDHDRIWKDDIDMAKFIIKNKVGNMNDYRALNYLLWTQLPITEIKKDEASWMNSDGPYKFPTYQDYVRYYTNVNKDTQSSQAILYYSSKHNIKHDLFFDKTTNVGQIDQYQYMTSKKIVDEVFYLPIIILIIVSVTSSGIVSAEHNKGTIKNIITTPIKRWKILLSKFIYLILHTYIIWIIGLGILSICAGVKYGFNDLFTPKLVYYNGNVIEVNYYLYLIKDLCIAGIPIIAFLSILFFISTVSLNTVLTTSVTTILAILPLILYYVCANFKTTFLFLTHLPFMYFIPGFIMTKQEWYTEIIKKTDMSLMSGVIISIITIVILYTITNIVYYKRDIKN